MNVLPSRGTLGSENLFPAASAGTVVGDAWLPASEVERLAPGKLGALRRLAGKGPLTHDACRDCRGAYKALDVPGVAHEGDLFWGHESPRPVGTSVAHACPRCGGVLVTGDDLARAGGRAASESRV